MHYHPFLCVVTFDLCSTLVPEDAGRPYCPPLGSRLLLENWGLVTPCCFCGLRTHTDEPFLTLLNFSTNQGCWFSLQCCNHIGTISQYITLHSSIFGKKQKQTHATFLCMATLWDLQHCFIAGEKKHIDPIGLKKCPLGSGNVERTLLANYSPSYMRTPSNHTTKRLLLHKNTLN